jgi:hypothetical protein
MTSSSLTIQNIERHKAEIARNDLSKPVRLALVVQKTFQAYFEQIYHTLKRPILVDFLWILNKASY